MKWFQWNPASYSDEKKLGSMIDDMPQSPIKKLPKIITLLENPASPFYLPGPAKIDVHDLIHCILLRGLRAQDEAFVIGFTMGAAKGAAAADRLLFKNISAALYPKPYDFSKNDLRVYDIGFDLGLEHEMKNIHLIDPNSYRELNWTNAINNSGIDIKKLCTAFEREINLGYSNKASLRLKTTLQKLMNFAPKNSILSTNPTPPSGQYDVALSFAGEDRDYVRRVAELLLASGIKVFYDEYEKGNLWGKDLFAHLINVYKDQAKFTIMFLSKAYKEKLWANHERKAAQANAFGSHQEHILPVRFDDTTIPGVLSTTGYIDLRTTAPEELAELVEQKILHQL